MVVSCQIAILKIINTLTLLFLECPPSVIPTRCAGFYLPSNSCHRIFCLFVRNDAEHFCIMQLQLWPLVVGSHMPWSCWTRPPPTMLHPSQLSTTKLHPCNQPCHASHATSSCSRMEPLVVTPHSTPVSRHVELACLAIHGGQGHPFNWHSLAS